MGDSRGLAVSARRGLLVRAKDQIIYAGIRAAIAGATIGDPDATLSAARALGRGFALAPFNAKRLLRAQQNLEEAFPDWTDRQRKETAVRGYEHLVMLGVEIALTGRLISHDGWAGRANLGELAGAIDALLGRGPVVLVTGHVGNWELTAYLMAMLGFKIHALYRPLDLAPLDEWVRASRSRRGMHLLDKFGAIRELPQILERGDHVGFVADQNAGTRGVFVPFCGRLASTYKAIGITAVRHNAPVVVGWARRVGGQPGQGGVEVRPRALRFDLNIVDVFGPSDWKDAPDPAFYVTARYRRALEGAVRQAPEQTLWMHRFWKSRPKHELDGRPFPEQLERKLRELPWMTGTELDRIKARSERDTREVAAMSPKERRKAGASED
jgi:KDO2-lipid IV(A) lauroyltransferase